MRARLISLNECDSGGAAPGSLTLMLPVLRILTDSGYEIKAVRKRLAGYNDIFWVMSRVAIDCAAPRKLQGTIKKISGAMQRQQADRLRG